MSIKFNFNSFETVGKKESTRKGNGSVKRVCAFCGKEFITYPWRGAGKYCSHKCATDATKVEHIPNVKCCICNKPIYIKPSRLERSKTKMFTCSKECMGKMRSKVFVGELNPNYNNTKDRVLYTNNGKQYYHCIRHNHLYKGYLDYVPEHRLIVEEHYNLFDKKYFNIIDGKYYLKPEIDVHHIDKNGLNNDINNLIPLTRSEHTSIHNNEKTIIRDVDGRIKTVVFKQGELLETHNDNDNQQPSISSNAFKGSTTNSRVQTDNAEDSNADTSALPSINTSDDIV